MAAIITAAKMSFKGFGEAFDKDAKKAAEALAKLPPQAQKAVLALRGVYTQIQKPVQNAFWEVMDTALQDTVKKLLPSLKDGLSNVSRGFAEVSRQVLFAFGRMADGSLMNMLTNLGEGLKNMAPGFGALIDAFGTLGEVGSTYLPRFGEWTTELATRFKNFIDEAERTGKINEWINTGIQRLQEMGSIVKSTTGIFSGLTQAARLAGAPGLTEMAASMRDIRDIVNGEPFQSRLVIILEGARTGVDKLKDGFRSLTDFIGESAQSIGIFLDKAGEIAGISFERIRTLFDGTGLGTGLLTAMDGLKQLLVAIEPGIADLGEALGILGNVAGEVIKAMGPGLNQLFETIAGALQRVEDGVIRMIPVFNDFITDLMELAQGPIFAVAQGIGDMLTALSEAPQAFQTLIMSAGLFLLLAPKFMRFFDGFQDSLRKNETRSAQSFNRMGDGARQVARGMSQSFAGFPASVEHAAIQASQGLRKNFALAVDSMPPKARAAATGIGNAFKSIGAGFMAGAFGTFTRELEPVRRGLADLPQNTRNAATRMRENFRNGLAGLGNAIAPADTALRRWADNTRAVSGQMHANLAPARAAFTNLAQHAGTAAMGAASTMASGLKTIGGGLLNFIGGPIGLAVMAITAIIGDYAVKAAESKQRIEGLAGTLDQVTGASTNATKKMITNNLDLKKSWMGVFDGESGKQIAQNAKVPLEDVVDAANGVPGAMKKVQIALGQSGNAATKMGQSIQVIHKLLEKTPLKGVSDLIDTWGWGQSEGDKLNSVINAQNAELEAARKHVEEVAKATDTNTVAAAKMAQNYETLESATSSVSDKVSALQSNLDLLTGNLNSGRKAARDHAETMLDLGDKFKDIAEKTEGAIDANGRYSDSFRDTLVDANGMFVTTNRQAIEFSKAMDGAAESILTVGMTEMQRLLDAGEKLPVAQQAAMAKMQPEMDKLRQKLVDLGFDSDKVNGIMSQIGLDPEKLVGALVLNTKDAEGEAARAKMQIEATIAGNYEVALSATSEDVKAEILKTEEYRKAFADGGWKAVIELINKSGPGIGEFMVDIGKAKEAKDVRAVIDAEFPGAKVIEQATTKLEQYNQTPASIKELKGKDDVSMVAEGAIKAVQGFDGLEVSADLSAQDMTSVGLGQAQISMESLGNVTKYFFAEDQTGSGKQAAAITMGTLMDVTRTLFSKDSTAEGKANAMATMAALPNVVRDLLANNAAKQGKEEAQKTINALTGKSVDVSVNDKASGVVQDIDTKQIANKSFNIIGVLSGVSEVVRKALGMAHGGIMEGGIQTFAKGGINLPNVKQYANGGTENHVAQIARGAWPVRVWAEPETGGEAYLPLHKSKRKRSLKILEEVADMFGYNLSKKLEFANGGLIRSMEARSVSMTSSSSNGGGIVYAAPQAPVNGATVPNINMYVQPSPGLDEEKVAEIAAADLYWKFVNR
jgi:hypothetical protein